MTAHVHADLMALYAQDAKETDEPWERWQYKNCRSKEGEWVNPHSELGFHPWCEYRRKSSNGEKLFNAFYPDGRSCSWNEFHSANKDLYEQAAERFLNSIKEQ